MILSISLDVPGGGSLRGLENWIRLLGIVTFRARRYAALIWPRYKTERRRRRRKTAKNFFYINYFCQTFGWKAQEKLKLVDVFGTWNCAFGWIDSFVPKAIEKYLY